MKLRNKKTGKIVELQVHHIAGKCYESLADVNKEWEDYEEPKEYWFIDEFGLVQKEIEYYYEENKEAVHDKRIAVGNYFETREEAEKAVEKLKAWKRLKDKGFNFTDGLVYGEYYGCGSVTFIISPCKKEKDVIDDLKLLFGGKE